MESVSDAAIHGKPRPAIGLPPVSVPVSPAPRQRQANSGKRAPSNDQEPVQVSAVASFGRSASIVSLAFVASRVLGLVREVILAREFGTSGEYDAYVSAFRVPDLLFLVVMSGAFGSAFIPVFSGFLTRGDRDSAWRLASAVINLTAVTTIVLGILAFAVAGPIMSYVVSPGLPPELHEIATRTMRILLLSPILLGLGIAAKGILEAQDSFTFPALAPVVYNVAIIASALVLAPSRGVDGLAIGVVAGALLHVAIQVPGLIRSGMRYTPVLSTHIAGLADVGRLLLPRVVGQAAFQINFIVVNAFASHDGEGKVSALNYAWQLIMLPHGVLALSISTVVFPAMARLFQQGDTAGATATLRRALGPLLFLTLPASIGLFEFRTAIVQTIFQSGEFSGRSTHLVADPLAFLAIGLTWYALVEVLTRIYYAMHDTKTPVVAGIVIILINIVLGKVLVETVGYSGLALSLSVTTGIEALILMFIFQRRLGAFDTALASWFARVVVATAIMAAVTVILRRPLDEATVPGEAHRLVQLALLAYTMALAAGTYIVAAICLRLPEADRVVTTATQMLRSMAGPLSRPRRG